MSKTFEFWFDVGSPAAYLAWTQLPALEAATGAQARLRPMLLGGVFQATGNRSPAAIAAKGDYTFTDFGRYARRYGVPLRRNPHFPINTLTLMRAAAGLQLHEPARLGAYLDGVFRAIWVDGRNLNEPAETAAAWAAAGFEPQALMALAQAPDVKAHLKALTEEAVARGIFGAPSFFVGPDLFWGQDRLDFVKEALS